MATKAQCQLALDQYEGKLSAIENVVGLGIVKDETAKSAGKNKLAVAVYVEKMRDNQALPKELEVHSKKKATKVPVVIIEQGRPELETLGKEPL